MNDKLTQLLEQLAAKLGTTAEYLWKVLIAQGRISATTSLIVLILTVLYSVLVWKTHMRFLKPTKDYDSLYDENEGFIPIMAVMTGALIIMAIWSLSDISNIINGYFNPEYWALKEVLDLL